MYGVGTRPSLFAMGNQLLQLGCLELMRVRVRCGEQAATVVNTKRNARASARMASQGGSD